MRELQHEEARRTCGVLNTLSQRRARQASMEAFGRRGQRSGRYGETYAGRAEPLEPRQGLVLGTFATRASGGSRLRSHAGGPVPSYGAVPQMAQGQEAQRLHVCAA